MADSRLIDPAKLAACRAQCEGDPLEWWTPSTVLRLLDCIDALTEQLDDVPTLIDFTHARPVRASSGLLAMTGGGTLVIEHRGQRRTFAVTESKVEAVGRAGGGLGWGEFSAAEMTGNPKPVHSGGGATDA